MSVFDAQTVSGANVRMDQKILPVKIAYLDEKLGIKSVWSNVSADDDMYVLEFVDEKGSFKKNVDRNMLIRFQRELNAGLKANMDNGAWSSYCPIMDSKRYVQYYKLYGFSYERPQY